MSRIKSYTNSDTDENDAIDLFKSFLPNNLFKKEINARDKIPTHDGWFDITEDSGKSIATIFVQVKKHPNNLEDNKIKLPLDAYDYQKEVNYCPFLFISADVQNKIVYWVYVHDELINTKNIYLKDIEIEQQTTIIKINDNDFDKGIITEENIHNLDFYDKWIHISEEHISRREDYRSLINEINEIKKNAEPTLLMTDPNFVHIHRFLDVLNDELDNFPIIKERLYPNSWKLGFLFSEFSNFLSFLLYSISWNVNDVQIRKAKDFNELREKNQIVMMHYDNPIIKGNYHEYSLDVIRTNLDMLSNDNLFFINNEFLANEFLFFFVSEYYGFLNLKNSSNYNLSEIRNNLIHRIQNQNIHFNFSKKFPLNVIIESIQFLESKNIKVVERPYPQKDTNELRGNLHYTDKYGYSGYTKEETFEYIEIFFKNLPSVYNSFFNQNTENLDSLNQFHNVDTIFVIFHLNIDKFPNEPTVDVIYCKSNSNRFSSKIFWDGDDDIPNELKNDESRFVKFLFDNKEYEVVSTTSELAILIFLDTPMLEYVKRMLNSNLRDYLRNNTHNLKKFKYLN